LAFILVDVILIYLWFINLNGRTARILSNKDSYSGFMAKNITKNVKSCDLVYRYLVKTQLTFLTIKDLDSFKEEKNAI